MTSIFNDNPPTAKRRSPNCSDHPNVPRAALAQWLYSARGNRPKPDGNDLYADPAWDILLDLYVQDWEGKLTSVTSACIASRVPPSTALRWISVLVKSGWVSRVESTEDRRCSYLNITQEGKHHLDEYLRETMGSLWKLLPDSLAQLDFSQTDELCDKIDKLTKALEENSRLLRSGMEQIGQIPSQDPDFHTKKLIKLTNDADAGTSEND